MRDFTLLEWMKKARLSSSTVAEMAGFNDPKSAGKTKVQRHARGLCWPSFEAIEKYGRISGGAVTVEGIMKPFREARRAKG